MIKHGMGTVTVLDVVMFGYKNPTKHKAIHMLILFFFNLLYVVIFCQLWSVYFVSILSNFFVNLNPIRTRNGSYSWDPYPHRLFGLNPI